nr:hypothetical protein [uncultured Rhodoferax sp.]
MFKTVTTACCMTLQYNKKATLANADVLADLIPKCMLLRGDCAVVSCR